MDDSPTIRALLEQVAELYTDNVRLQESLQKTSREAKMHREAKARWKASAIMRGECLQAHGIALPDDETIWYDRKEETDG